MSRPHFLVGVIAFVFAAIVLGCQEGNEGAPPPDSGLGPDLVDPSDAAIEDAEVPDDVLDDDAEPVIDVLDDIEPPSDVLDDASLPTDVPGDTDPGDVALLDVGDVPSVVLACEPEPEDWTPRALWKQIKSPIPDYAKPSNNFNLISTIQLLQSLVSGAMKLLDKPETLLGDELHGWCICDSAPNCVVQQITDIDAQLKTVGGVITAKLTSLETWRSGIEGSVGVAWDATLVAGDELVQSLEAPLQTFATAAGKPLAEVKAVFGQCFEDGVKQEFTALVTDVKAYVNVHWQPTKAAIARVIDYFKGLESVGDLVKTLPELIAAVKGAVDVYNHHIKVLFDGTLDLGGDLTALLDTRWVSLRQRLSQCLEATYPGVAAAVETLLTDTTAAVKAKAEALLALWKDVRVDLEGVMQAFIGSISQIGEGEFWEDAFDDLMEQQLANILGCVEWLPLDSCMEPDGDNPSDAKGCGEGGRGGFLLWLPTDIHKQPGQAALFALKYTGILDKAKEWLDSFMKRTGGVGEKLLAALKNIEEILTIIFEYMDRFVEGYHLGAYDELRPALHHCVGYAGHAAYARMASLCGGDVSIGARYTSHNLSRKQRAQFRSGGFGLEIFDDQFSLVPSVEALMQLDGFKLWDHAKPFGLPLPIDQTVKLENTGVFHLLKDDASPDDQAQDTMKVPGYVPNLPYSLGNLLFKDMYPAEVDTAGDAAAPFEQFPRPENDLFDETSTAVVAIGLNLPLKMGPEVYDLPDIPIWPPFVTMYPYFSIEAGIGWYQTVNHFRDALKVGITKRVPTLDVPDDVFLRDDYPAHFLQAPDLTDDMGTTAYIQPGIGADIVAGITLSKWLKIGITAGIGLSIEVAVEGNAGLYDLNRNVADVLERVNPPRDAPCRPVMDAQRKRVCSNRYGALASLSGKSWACDGADGLDDVWYRMRATFFDVVERMKTFGEATEALLKSTKEDALDALEQCRKDWDTEWLAVRDEANKAIVAIEALGKAGSVADVKAQVLVVKDVLLALKPKVTGLKSRVEQLSQGCLDALDAERKKAVDTFLGLVDQLEKDVLSKVEDALSSVLPGSECEQRGACTLPGGKIVPDVTEAECLSLTEPKPTDQGICCYGDLSPNPVLPPPKVSCKDGLNNVQRTPPTDDQVFAKMTRAQCETAGGGFTAFANGDAAPDVVTRTFKNVTTEPAEFMCSTTFDGPDEYELACSGGTEPWPIENVPFRVIFRNPVKAPSVAPTYMPYTCVTEINPVVTGWEGPGCHPLSQGFPSACGCVGTACAAGETCSADAGSCVDTATCTCDPPQDEDCSAGRACVRGACIRTCATHADCGEWEECVAGDTDGELVCVAKYGLPYAEEAAWLMRQKDAPSHTIATYALAVLRLTAYLRAWLSIGAELKLFFGKFKFTIFDWNDFWELFALNRAWFQHGLSVDYEGMCYDFDYANPSYDRGKVTNFQPELVTRYQGGPTLEEFLEWCDHETRRGGAERFRNADEAPNPDRIVHDFNSMLDWSQGFAKTVWDTRKDLCGEGMGFEEAMKKFMSRSKDWACVVERTGEGPSLLGADAEGKAEIWCDDLDLYLLHSAGCLELAPPPSGLGIAPMSFTRPSPLGSISMWPLRSLLEDEAAVFSTENLKAVHQTAPVLAWMNQLALCASSKISESSWKVTVRLDEIEGCGGGCSHGKDKDGKPCGYGGAYGTYNGGKAPHWDVDSTNGEPESEDPFGACCRVDTGCEDGTTSDTCDGEFYPGEACGEVECSPKKSDDPADDPYEREGACCLREPKDGEAPCQITFAFACEGCFHEAKSCEEIEFCEPEDTRLCPPTEGSPGSGSDPGDGDDPDPPCDEPVPSCGADAELLSGGCANVTPPSPEDCPPKTEPFADCSAAGAACGKTWVCATTGCRVPNKPVKTIVCSDGTVELTPVCPGVVNVTIGSVTVGGTISGVTAGTPTWTPPLPTCEPPTLAEPVTYDAFMFRNATTATTTWAISADFGADAIAHVYYGAFDPKTGSAGGTAGGFCLGSSGPGFAVEPFLAEPGALVTVVASPRTAIPGTAYAVTVTAE